MTSFRLRAIVTLLLLSVFTLNCGERQWTSVGADSVYSSVAKRGSIRAAYTIYHPGCLKDENGKLVGVFVETLEEAARLLDLKVEWTEEVGWGTQIEGLETGRYDMIGSSVWGNPKRAKAATLSIPLYFSPIYIYTRTAENRFDGLKGWESLNNKDVRIATIDGGTGEQIAKSDFPNATRVALPQLTDFSQSFLDVVGNKADIVLMEPFQASKFLASNPNTIKNINSERPMRTFGNHYMFRRNEHEFQEMLNTVLQDLINSGFVDRLLDKYETYPNSYLRAAKPYQVAK